ncbi:MAG TPA: protein kinase [Planctomycetota bacterium]|nr:protein kinase [Planctomycetota bacterium]
MSSSAPPSNTKIAQIAVNMGFVTQGQVQEVLSAGDALQRAGLPIPNLLDSLIQKRLITPAQREQLEANLENLEAGHVRRLGKYRLQYKLGEGGMGAVYLAEDSKLERKCAIKVLPPEFSRDAKRVAKFTSEAKLTAALNHVNIIQVYDIDQIDGFSFYAMEYLEGQSLEDVITRAGRLTVDETLTYSIQLARGLAHAHAKGIVHRDIKPSNAYVCKDGTLKILDLGLSVQTTGFNLAVAGTAIGTPLYISPEQAAGRADVDERSDIYSTGILMYRLLTGQVPYMAQTPAALMQMHMKAPIPDVCSLQPEVPQELSAIIRKCMAKAPNDRVQSCQALLDDLESLRNSKVIGEHREEIRSGRIGGKHRILQSGERFGKYKILRKLGEGTMGVLYLSEDTLLTRQVALKILPRELSIRPQFAERFRKEIQTIAGLTHANIAESHDVGVIDEHLYYDTEYIDGLSLADHIHRVMRLEPRKALEILLQVARALKQVHKQGAVHRHINPNNILLAKNGTAKLTMLSGGTERPDTWSPEQARELRNVDGRSDVYSLGCVFFLMLTGHMPYQSGSVAMLLTKHINEPPPNPRALAPGTPGEYCQVLGMMMAKQLDDRYLDADALVEDLEALVAGKTPVHAGKRPEPAQMLPVRRKRSMSSGRYPRHPGLLEGSRDGVRDSRHDSRSDSRHDARSDSRHEFRHDLRGDSRHDSRLDSRHDARSDSRGEARSEARTEAKAEARRERRRVPVVRPTPASEQAKSALMAILPKNWVGWAAIGLTLALAMRAGLMYWLWTSMWMHP